MHILREYTKDSYLVVEYTRDGETVLYSTENIITDDVPVSLIELQPTIDDIAEETLLETKYQTLLLEMML